jgi:spore coat polysaccharide biosynthesis protein SpsF
MSSSRLPGKVLRAICGRPMMLRQIERISRARLIDRLVVATSVECEDDAIFEVCETAGVICRRGPLADVLQRFVVAAEPDVPDHLVRLTADCPLADVSVIDDLIALHLREDHDYTSNTITRSFPHGLDCEVTKWSALRQAAESASSAYDREHVTPYLYNPLNKFRTGQLVNHEDLSFLRWTVDYPEDFLFVDAVYDALYDRKAAFGTSDVIALLGARSELREVNSMHLPPKGVLKCKHFWNAYDERQALRAF